MEGKAYSDEGKPFQSDEKLILLYCPGRGSNSQPSARRGVNMIKVSYALTTRPRRRGSLQQLELRPILPAVTPIAVLALCVARLSCSDPHIIITPLQPMATLRVCRSRETPRRLQDFHA